MKTKSEMKNVKSMKSLRTVVALLVIACCACVSSVRAQVTFNTPVTISGDGDVYTAGTLVYAYEIDATPATVNGVPFSAAGSGVTLTGFGSSYNGYGSSSSPFAGLTTAYQDILFGGDYHDSTSVSVTLNSLTSGHVYAVQLWVDDSRGSSRTETVTSSGGNTVTLTYCVGGAGGGVGQYTIGTFTASGTTQVITLNGGSSGSSQLNAIQVRDITAAITFGPGTTLAGDSDVLAVGTLVYAYDLANVNVTVNGVTFTGSTGTSSLGSGNITTTGFAYNGTTTYGPGSSYSTEYQAMLQGSDWNGGTGACTVTLNNLTAGQTYAVQLWANDSRGCCGSRNNSVVSTPLAGNTVTVAFNDSTGWGPGQYTIGIFIASSASESFTLTGNSTAQINAIQVRNITGVAGISFQGTATTIAGDADVYTGGTLLYAYCGIASGNSATVNGVTFNGTPSWTYTTSSNITCDFNGGANSAFTAASGTFNGLSSAYKTMLQGAFTENPTAPVTVSLNNLTVGHTYAVQVWVDDPRGGYNTRTENITSGYYGGVTLSYASSSAVGAVGQYITGIFTALATSQSFTLTGNSGGSSQMNAIQVRDISGAAVTFSPPATIAGDSDVYTAGTLLYAYDQSGTAATVNGVPFTAAGCNAIFGSVTTTFNACTYNAYGAGTGAPFTSLSSGYQTVLEGGIFNGAVPVTVALGGLTSGHTYAVQIWVDDSRNGYSEGTRYETVTSGGGNTVTLWYNPTGALGGLGQYTIGIFTASGTVQSITLTGNNSTQLNALQVRDITTVYSAKGASGTDLTASGNWTDSTEPGSSAIAAWNSSSLGTSLTLNSAESWGGISVSGAASNIGITGAGTLTLGASGINMSLAPVNLSIGTPITLGANQIWAVNSGQTLTSSGAISGGYSLTVTSSVGSVTYNAAYLPASPTTVTAFTGLPLASITSVGASIGGGYIAGPGPGTVCYFLNDGTTWATFQLQKYDGGYTKCVKVALTNSSGNITATVLYAKYDPSGVNDVGENFDAISSTASTVATSSGANGYGVSSITVNQGGAGSPGIVNLAGANIYTGGTTDNAGTLQLGAANAIPGNTYGGDVTVNGTLDLNTYSDTINGLNGSGTVDTVAGGTPVLTVGANGDSGSFSGVIKNSSGTLALTKSGAGTQTLSGADTYSGNTTISAGTLALSGSGSIAFSPL